MIDCAIVGAGAAGLSAARVLQGRGLQVHVFDKGGRAGGRMASRNTEFGDFDHGAPFLRLRDPQLLPSTFAWQSQQLITPWSACSSVAQGPAWIGTPTINTLAQHWARGLDLLCEQTVCAIEGSARQWRLRFADDTVRGPYKQLIITAPAPQARVWLDSRGFADTLSRIHYDACLSLMWVPASRALPDLPMAYPQDHPAIAFIAREDLKPGRSGAPRYLLQARADWSEERIEHSSESAGAELLALSAAWLDIDPDALHLQAHRWRYALVREALNQPCISLDNGLHYAGDGCLGPGIESAMLSGIAAAQAVLDQQRLAR